MKKILITTLVCLFVLVISSTAKAVSLLPGGAVQPTNPQPPPLSVWPWNTSTFVTTTGDIGFTNVKYSGKVKQDVYINPTGYLFVYSLESYVTSIDPITRMTATDFDGFTTDVDAATPGNDLPHWITRTASGGTVGFQFNQSPPSSDGGLINDTSATMWIQTNAQYYGLGWITLQNGRVENIQAFAPAVPEPSSMLLFGMGILGLFGLKRKV